MRVTARPSKPRNVSRMKSRNFLQIAAGVVSIAVLTAPDIRTSICISGLLMAMTACLVPGSSPHLGDVCTSRDPCPDGLVCYRNGCYENCAAPDEPPRPGGWCRFPANAQNPGRPERSVQACGGLHACQELCEAVVEDCRALRFTATPPARQSNAPAECRTRYDGALECDW